MKIALLPGDGIGSELMASAQAVLDRLEKVYNLNFERKTFPFGGAGIDQCGHPYPEETQKGIRSADAILLGAIGGPQYNDAPCTPEAGLLMMRKDLSLFANFRPVKVPASTSHLSPVKAEIVTGTDFVVVRELTGGVYFGDKQEGTDFAQDTMPYSREEVERIARKAFDLAMSRRKHLTLVDKANVLATSRLWRHVVGQVAKDYPEVEADYLYVDAAAMKIISSPTQFDVILTENLFGDILSDEASILAGSLGMLPSASHGADKLSLYEPIHGSAPDIAGKDIANPSSMLLSVSMMLSQSFNLDEPARSLEDALYGAIDDGIRTADLGGDAGTKAFTQAVVERIK